MPNMLGNTARMPISEFRSHVGAERLGRLLEEHSVVEVGRYVSEVNAVVVAPGLFAELASVADELAELRRALPLMIAAARTGIAIPSETLAHLGFEPADDSWQAINEFQAQIPVHLTRGADGELLARGELTGTFIPEADLELDEID